MNLLADSKQVCLEFIRFLQKKVFRYFDNSHKINTFTVACTLTIDVYEKMAKYRKKTTAPNRQFGASGGVASCDTSQDFGSSPPVQALLIPPPDAKLLKRWAQPAYGAAVQ